MGAWFGIQSLRAAKELSTPLRGIVRSSRLDLRASQSELPLQFPRRFRPATTGVFLADFCPACHCLRRIGLSKDKQSCQLKNECFVFHGMFSRNWVCSRV